MILGNTRILTCPYCGQRKEVLSLLSGNTFGSTYWSDGKVVSPMMSHVSGIPKCPFCGKFYFTSNQGEKYSDTVSFESGTLSFDDCKSAVEQFDGGELAIQEKLYLYYLTITAYNDKYYRSNDGSEEIEPAQIEQPDFEYFCSIVIEYLRLMSDIDALFKAELLREIKRFDDCISSLKSIPTNDELRKKMKAKIF